MFSNVNTTNLNLIMDKHGLSLIYLFGSQVTGQIHDNSDVDIAVVPNTGYKINKLSLIADLANEFHVDDIDLTDLSRANPLTLMSVLQTGQLLAGKKSEGQNFELQAFHQYNDYLPFLKMENDLVKSQLN